MLNTDLIEIISNIAILERWEHVRVRLKDQESEPNPCLPSWKFNKQCLKWKRNNKIILFRRYGKTYEIY